MKVAVLTLTRDRLEYTKWCFSTLRAYAGCAYDHYVFDQGSQDGTPEYLRWHGDVKFIAHDENIGCCRGWNALLEICDPADYDVIVTFDNDCELLQPDTLKTVAGLTAQHGVILSPRVRGLMYPPAAIAHFTLGDYEIEETRILGNIFMAIPARLFTEGNFRWDSQRYQVWDGGESITQWYRARGGRCGYVGGYEVNHYKTTLGQVDDIPWYFERRVAEGGRAQ